MRALQRRRSRRRAAVRNLHVADIEVVVGEDRAAHRTHQDGAVLQAELGQRFSNELVRRCHGRSPGNSGSAAATRDLRS